MMPRPFSMVHLSVALVILANGCCREVDGLLTSPSKRRIPATRLFASPNYYSLETNDANGTNRKNHRRQDGRVGIEEISRSEALERLCTPLFSAASLLLLRPSHANALYENAPVRVESDDKTGPVQLPSGVTYEDLRPGTGDVVTEGKRVNVQWVLKRSNGYYVDSSERNDGVPFIFTVGDPTGAIAGLDEGIRGMRAGGIRRIIIPPELSYVEGVEDGKPGPVPVGFGPKQRMRRVMTLLKDIPGECILLDVKATRVQ